MSERELEDRRKEAELEPGATGADFIRSIIREDVRTGRNGGRVHTRFPPEPNGYLHIGHAKSIFLNFGIAREFGGLCNLRLDDTNPLKEEMEYIDSIKEDVRWLGFDWAEREYYASDYFEQLYEWARQLIRDGKAYVCDLSADEIREFRGTLTEPGRNSPHRDRPAEESLDLFERMRSGEFPDGSRTLRARIDMASPNINLRDPVMYRIMHATHPRTGDAWCIYPTYDYAHGQSDAIEGITHSICTLEFENHRPLYDWYLEQIGPEHRPRQIEFARLNISYTVLSKRRLLRLVKERFVEGWDDPRMPTISGMRRRGYPSAAIIRFCDRIGVAKMNSTVDIALLEYFLRDDLNRNAPRSMVVLRPLKLVIENYPEDRVEQIETENNPEDPAAGTRTVPFCREVWIEREDFMADPPKKYFRLSPGAEVRLKGAYYVTCTGAIRDANGEIVEIRCTYDPESSGGGTPDGRKVKGTLHWVSARHGVDCEVRLYDRLFSKEDPNEVEEGKDFVDYMNPDSLQVLTGCKAEPALANPAPVTHQFLRHGYFFPDPKHSAPGRPVFNRTVSLRDTWAKIEKKFGSGDGS